MKIIVLVAIIAISSPISMSGCTSANLSQSALKKSSDNKAVKITQEFPANPLVGTWEWVNIKNGCKEIYIFAADGSSHITSGEEVSTARYTIAEKSSEKGFYKVTLKVLEDKGGKDCSDNVNDSTGEEYTNFLQFHPSGRLYVVCEKEATDSCIGPLNRVD